VKLLKIKNESCQTKAAKISQVEAGEWLATVCNFLPKNTKVEGVNYKYYIEKAERIINKIKTGGSRRIVAVDPNQISLQF
jgi:hypothetical protein